MDEALYYFRANVLFRTFEVQGDADRVLVYVTLFASQCLQEVATARCEVKADVQKVLRQLGGASTFALPGVAGFPVSAIISCAPSERGACCAHAARAPRNRRRPSGMHPARLAEPMRQYLKQLRAVTAERLYDRLINEDGSVNKWWLSFSKRKFMGKSL